MFERFTDRARRVVVLAQEEARLLNHNYIGTEHILLGLIHEGEGVAAKALESLGISLEAVRAQVEEIIGHGGSAPSGHIPFTPRAKKVLELSLREALQLGHNYIGTEHILLGLIREGEGVAAQVLVKSGADLSRVRQQVIQVLSGYTGSAVAVRRETPFRTIKSTTEVRSPAVEQAWRAAWANAGGGPLRSDDLLLALLGDESSMAAKAMASLGVSLDAVRERLDELRVTGTSDEMLEEAGARRVTVRVAEGRIVVEVDDPGLAELAGGDGELAGDDRRADFRDIWSAVRTAAIRMGQFTAEREE